MTLYIVRHGQTEENLQAILQGHLPGNLTEQGKEQVRKAAERLAEAGVEFKCIVSSDLKRAMDSAHIIAERLHLPITPMKELRERDWGIYTGMAVAEAAEKYKIDGIWRFPDSSAETDKGILQRRQHPTSSRRKIRHRHHHRSHPRPVCQKPVRPPPQVRLPRNPLLHKCRNQTTNHHLNQTHTHKPKGRFFWLQLCLIPDI